MITRSDDYVEYCRETAKHARDLHDLALRGSNKKETTRVTHERIVEAVKLGAQDELLDIGCGDGTLLRMAQQLGVKSAIGLLATEEEVALVRKTGVDARRGFSDQLPVADASISVVVCNNVLLIVPREKIPASLREIWRVARPGARIFIGEIPFVQPVDPTPRFDTTGEMLSYLYHRHGLRTWLGMVRQLAKAKITGTPFVMRPGTAVSFYATAEEFIAMAETAGLEIVSFWQHHDPANRNNYLFRKPL
ncbi:MAG TPA: class I SAM-dependent methyltransferase [Candidatus Sulfotelmatobacter sp.]|nr:class I SAM-dependent methyltransferase [Candidatus Sulfotelmatobacter sp.]